MSRFLSPNLEYALGWTVIHSLWQATAIALIIAILMIALRKQSAQTRYIVSCAGLVAILLASIVTFCFYFEFNTTTQSPHYLARTRIIHSIITDTRQLLNSSSRVSFQDYFNQHLPLIVSVWLMGVALFALRLLSGVSYIAYLKRYRNSPMLGDWQARIEYLSEQLGVHKAVEILESALVKAPMTIGALKPIILFPIGAVTYLSVEQMEAILAHELAHIRRNDYFFNILQSLVEIIFYFHPAVWWLSNTIRNERENCCDDIAVSVSGNSLSYAKALVNLQELHAHSPILVMGFLGNKSKQQLLNRVKRLLNQPQNKSNIMEKLVATCFLTTIIIFSTLGEKNNSPLTSITESSIGIKKQMGNQNLKIESDSTPTISDAQILAKLLKKLKKAHSLGGGNDFDGMEPYLEIDGKQVIGKELELYKLYAAKQSADNSHQVVLKLENELAQNIKSLNSELDKNKNNIYDQKMIDLQKEINSEEILLDEAKATFYEKFSRTLRLNDKVYLVDTFPNKSENPVSSSKNDGDFVYNDSQNDITVEYSSGKLVQLIIKGKAIQKQDFDKYSSFLKDKGISSFGISRNGKTDSISKKTSKSFGLNQEMFRHYLFENKKLLEDIKKNKLKGNLNMDSLFRQYNYDRFNYQFPLNSQIYKSPNNKFNKSYDDDTNQKIESLNSKIKSLQEIIEQKRYKAEFWDFYHDTNAALVILRNKLSRYNLTNEDLIKIDKLVHLLKAEIEDKLKTN